MKDNVYQFHAVLDEVWLELPDLCHLAGVPEIWVRQRLADGLLTPDSLSSMETMRFGAGDLRRVMRMATLERDFDAVPELASLVIDLELEVARLRARLRRLVDQVA